MDVPEGKYTLIFMGVPGDEGGEVELTHNWDEAGYGGGRNFGHLAFRVDDIYATCQRLMDAGVTINRPPRDGHMAFVKSPDGISIELLQKGAICRPPSPGRRCPTRELVMAHRSRSSPSRPSPTIISGWSTIADSGETAVVDPGDPGAGAGRGGQARLAHHHRSSTPTGIPTTPAATARSRKRPARRSSARPGENGRVPGLDRSVGEGDRVRLGAHEAEVWEVPGHTIGHIAYHLPRASRSPSSATLCSRWAAAGCSRAAPSRCIDSLAAGSPRLPDDTRLYCAHEYTLANARFAAHAFPDNEAIADRLAAGRAGTLATASRPFRRRSPRSAPPTPSCSPGMSNISRICGPKRTISVRPKFRLVRYNARTIEGESP